MSSDTPKVLDIAHHEAGHAVAGYLLGRRFTSLTIWGSIQFEPIPLEDRDAITTEIIATLAGAVNILHRFFARLEPPLSLDEM